MLWSEQEKIIGQCQTGLRQGKSMIDQMFILKTLIDKHLFRKRGRFCCLFVDFSKAFDTVNRDFLIYSLIKSGMHGKMLTLIRKVYSKVTAASRTQEGLAELFDCKFGSVRYTHIKVTREKGYFTHDINGMYTADNICKMIDFLIDNIFVQFGGRLFRHDWNSNGNQLCSITC